MSDDERTVLLLQLEYLNDGLQRLGMVPLVQLRAASAMDVGDLQESVTGTSAYLARAVRAIGEAG